MSTSTCRHATSHLPCFFRAPPCTVNTTVDVPHKHLPAVLLEDQTLTFSLSSLCKEKTTLKLEDNYLEAKNGPSLPRPMCADSIWFSSLPLSFSEPHVTAAFRWKETPFPVIFREAADRSRTMGGTSFESSSFPSTFRYLMTKFINPHNIVEI